MDFRPYILHHSSLLFLTQSYPSSTALFLPSTLRPLLVMHSRRHQWIRAVSDFYLKRWSSTQTRVCTPIFYVNAAPHIGCGSIFVLILFVVSQRITTGTRTLLYWLTHTRAIAGYVATTCSLQLEPMNMGRRYAIRNSGV